MGSQVGFVSKGSGTFLAAEGLLSCVCPEVTLEQPGPGESFAADVTLAGQSVGLDVHLESAVAVVGLTTIFTSGLALDLIRTVKLLVLGEA